MYESPKRPRWRKKRWQAAAALAAALAYPLSFVPACWVLMRVAPDVRSAEWQAIAVLYEPLAELLLASPQPVQDAAAGVVNVWATDGVTIGVRDEWIGVVFGDMNDPAGDWHAHAVWCP